MTGLFVALAALAQASQAPPAITISAAEIARAPRLTSAREPIWRIGGDADGPYSFTRVLGGTFTRDGVAVLEMTPPEVRLFSTTGKHISSFGRKGSGPGEFQEVQGLIPHAGDSLVVSQMPGISVFDARGKYGRTVSSVTTEVGYTMAVRVLSNGMILAHRHAIPPRVRQEGVRREIARIVVLSPLGDAIVSDLGERLFGETVIARHGDALIFTRRAFSAGQLLEGTDSLVLTMQTDAPRLAVFDARGRHRRTITFGLTAREVMSRDREGFARSRLAGRNESQRRAAEAYLKVMVYPDRMPYFDALRWSSDRVVRLRRYTAPLDTVAQWLSLTPAGHLLSVIDLPAKSRVLDFASDRVLLVERDADDVEYLSLYQLRPVQR